MSINSDQKMDTKEEEKEDHKEEEEDDEVQKKEIISDQSHHTIHGASPTQSHIDKEEEEQEAQGKYTISAPSSLSSPPQSHIDHKPTSPPKAYTPSSSVSSLCSNSNPSSPHTYSHEYKFSSAPNRTPPPKPLAPVANRSFKADPLVFTTRVDPEAQHGYTSVREVQGGVIVVDSGFDVGVDGDGGGRKLRPDPPISKKTRRDNNTMKKTFLGLRICAFVFCLISFSVMAADKQKGWALDSFYWYKEFR